MVFAEELDTGKETKKQNDTATTTGAFRAVGVQEELSSPTTTGSIRVVAPGPRGSKRRSEVTTVNTSSNQIETLSPKVSEPAATEEAAELAADLKASELDFREVGIVTWKVKVAIGLVYDFSDIMTLKKYLADQKVTPEDLISHNAKDWVRIGDIEDLDGHFVSTWKAARAAQKKSGEKSSKTKNKPTSNQDSEAKEAMAAASREVDAARSNFSPNLEDPFAKARDQRRSGQGRRKAPAKEKPSSGLPMGAIAALLVVGLIAVGIALFPPGADDLAPASPAPISEDGASDASVVSVDEADMEAHRDKVRKKIREDMKRRQQEIQAGMEEENPGIGEEGEPDPLEEAMRKARRVPVRPSEQRPTPNQTDAKGFRKPILRPTQTATKQATSRPASQGSAQVTSHETRDPGRLYYDNGRRAMERKNYGSALKMFQTSVDKSPNCGSCWEGLGSAYQILGETQKAAEAFKKAEELGVPVNAARP